jgi:hypothetical protein
MRISEQEKKDILSKYMDNTSDELLTHLKRNFPIFDQETNYSDKPAKFMLIGDKMRYLDISSKKYLVAKIFDMVSDQWNSLDTPTIRRTIKKFIDGAKNF